jgi:hypothetical protein
MMVYVGMVTGKSVLVLAVYNELAQDRTTLVRLPLGAGIGYQVLDSNGKPVNFQVNPLSPLDITLQHQVLGLLFLYGVSLSIPPPYHHLLPSFSVIIWSL